MTKNQYNDKMIISKSNNHEFMLETFLNIAQIVLPILLIVAILLQSKGSGLGAGFGGEGNVFRSKRGIEKKLHQTTIILATLFFIVAFLDIYLSR